MERHAARTGSRSGFEDPGPIEAQSVAAVDDATRGMRQDVDVGVFHRSQRAPGELFAGLAPTGVDARDHHVEPREQLVGVVKRRVGADLELGPMQDLKWSQQRVDAGNLRSLLFDPLR